MPKISSAFAISVILILAIFFGGMVWIIGNLQERYIYQPSAVIPTRQKIDQPNAVVPLETAKIEKVVYENKEFGFSVDLPPNWGAYKVTRRAGEGCEGCKDITFYITLSLPTQDNRWPPLDPFGDPREQSYAEVFFITVRTHANWDAQKVSPECHILRPGCPMEDDVVGRNDKYVFSVILPQEWPFDIEVPSDYAQYFKERFHLENKN